jgi:hypothetical protein
MPSHLPRLQHRDHFTTIILRAAMLAGTVLATPAVRAQDAASVIQLAERDRAALNAVGALGRYEAAFRTLPTNYDLLWRASREAVDLGEAASEAATRTEYNTKAEGYARRAVAANPNGADGHFMLAVALGRTALSLGSRERVKYAGEVRTSIRSTPVHCMSLASGMRRSCA